MFDCHDFFFFCLVEVLGVMLYVIFWTLSRRLEITVPKKIITPEAIKSLLRTFHERRNQKTFAAAMMFNV